MRKVLTVAMAAMTLGGTVLATAAPAEAQSYYGGDGRYYGGGYEHRSRDNSGVAVAAGVIGLALGAAIASNHNGYSNSYDSRSYYNRSYYNRSYYNQSYDGGGYGYYNAPAYAYEYPAYQTCATTRWVWDPYIGRQVAMRQTYAC